MCGDQNQNRLAGYLHRGTVSYSDSVVLRRSECLAAAHARTMHCCPVGALASAPLSVRSVQQCAALEEEPGGGAKRFLLYQGSLGT